MPGHNYTYDRVTLMAAAAAGDSHKRAALANTCERRADLIEHKVGWPALADSWRASAIEIRQMARGVG